MTSSCLDYPGDAGLPGAVGDGVGGLRSSPSVCRIPHVFDKTLTYGHMRTGHRSSVHSNISNRDQWGHQRCFRAIHRKHQSNETTAYGFVLLEIGSLLDSPLPVWNELRFRSLRLGLRFLDPLSLHWNYNSPLLLDRVLQVLLGPASEFIANVLELRSLAFEVGKILHQMKKSVV